MNFSLEMIRFVLWLAITRSCIALSSAPDYQSELRSYLDSSNLDFCGRCSICGSCYASCPINSSLTNSSNFSDCLLDGPVGNSFWNCACNEHRNAATSTLQEIAQSCTSLDPTVVVIAFETFCAEFIPFSTGSASVSEQITAFSGVAETTSSKNVSSSTIRSTCKSYERWFD